MPTTSPLIQFYKGAISVKVINNDIFRYGKREGGKKRERRKRKPYLTKYDGFLPYNIHIDLTFMLKYSYMGIVILSNILPGINIKG